MTWLSKPIPARILKGVAAAWLLASSPALTPLAQANNWGEMAMVSETMGVFDSRICIGEASRGDLGCPSYAPTISPTGRINASAGLTVDSVSLTTVSVTWGYLGSAASYLPNLTSNAVSATNISVSTINGTLVSALGGGATPGTLRVFTASGTYTKPAGLVAAKITVIGGGGGGGGKSSSTSSSGAGGGGGAAISLLLATDIPSSVTVTVGAGGAGGSTSGSNGGSGGNSSFGSLVQATGSCGGQGNAGTAITLCGGAGTVGQLLFQGGTSLPSVLPSGFTEKAGTSILGIAGANAYAGDGAGGSAPPNTGGGGGIATTTSTARAGGAGGSGIVIVEEYFAGGSSGSSGGTSSTVVATNPAGSTGQIQYNSGGSFAASAGLLWDDGASRLTAVNISATALTVNGVAITGGVGASGDRIISGTTSAIANPAGSIDVSGSMRVDGTLQLMSVTTAPVCSAATAGAIARINGKTFECRL